VITTLRRWVKEIPPVENGNSRYGNPAFQQFYDRVVTEVNVLLDFVQPKEAIIEVGAYFCQSFGERTRVDYGTGHEANFMAFLLCLEKLGLLTEKDNAAVVLNVFYNYIDLMRDLQFNYWLEPAGSQGVWGLDDYHFLPFMFGSAQLHDHKYFRPKSIHNREVVEEFAKDYMYFACIQFVNSVKTESLRWHSPMLDDISTAKSWAKVNAGMIKMYKAEVLGKLPIMQHFLFGCLLSFHGETMSETRERAECEMGHVHAMGQEVPTCCISRLPSAIAARGGYGAMGTCDISRPLPFD